MPGFGINIMIPFFRIIEKYPIVSVGFIMCLYFIKATSGKLINIIRFIPLLPRALFFMSFIISFRSFRVILVLDHSG